MVEKLRSTLKRTNWSLLLKAILFAVAWAFLPFWIFFFVALYLYFVPFAGSAKVALPFWILLLIAFLEGPNIWFALILALIFYYILLIRDLLIIDRRSAYEVLVLALSYLLIRSFFLKEGGNFGGWSLFYSFVVAIVLSVMLGSFVKHFSVTSGAEGGVSREAEINLSEARTFRRVLGWISFILMWQLLIAALFLPLDFVYQSAVVFLIAATFIDLVPHYAFGEFSRKKVLAVSTVMFSLLVIILATAHWVL